VGDQGWIAVTEHGFQIVGNVPVGLQIRRAIPGNGFGLAFGAALVLAIAVS
jgi:hypothetical protein